MHDELCTDFDVLDGWDISGEVLNEDQYLAFAWAMILLGVIGGLVLGLVLVRMGL